MVDVHELEKEWSNGEIIKVGELTVGADYRDWGWWHVFGKNGEIISTHGTVWKAIIKALEMET